MDGNYYNGGMCCEEESIKSNISLGASAEWC